MVLFLFVIMLVNLDEQAKERQFNGQRWIALALRHRRRRAGIYFLRMGSGAFQLARPAEEASGVVKGNTEMIADAAVLRIPACRSKSHRASAGARVGSVVMAKRGFELCSR